MLAAADEALRVAAGIAQTVPGLHRDRHFRIADLQHPIDHDDRKPLSRWLQSQGNYAREEADKLLHTPWRELGWPDRVRRVPLLAAPLVATYCLTVKGCALDGRPGIAYACQRVIAELLVSHELLQRRFER